MNHPLWIGDLTSARRDTAFGNGEGQLGFSVLRIFVSENRANWRREAATAKRAIELGAHLYDTPFQNFPYPLFKQKGGCKELWMTEVYYPNSSDSADRWPQALDVGEHIHRAMVDAEFQAYVWWYIRRGYGPMREDGRMSKRGAAMALFAKFVRPGHVRIAVTSNRVTGLFPATDRSHNS
jgi:glucuronoarabinoxylan endo-1,4-beta-xylanase